jgi:hypothetical protein
MIVVDAYEFFLCYYNLLAIEIIVAMNTTKMTLKNGIVSVQKFTHKTI